jgi:hypothetical protein
VLYTTETTRDATECYILVIPFAAVKWAIYLCLGVAAFHIVANAYPVDSAAYNIL